jgi:hypothetical protein
MKQVSLLLQESIKRSKKQWMNGAENSYELRVMSQEFTTFTMRLTKNSEL